MFKKIINKFKKPIPTKSQTMYKTIADMESEGVYFSDDIIEKLKEIKEESICHYSGLVSTKSWK
jgi:hypothetical protein